MLPLIEGFGGKRALGFLFKSEVCQKRSKFRMEFCLRGSNNVLHVFSLKFASFLRYYVCEKTHFSKAILWGPFVERKTREAFCFAKPWSQYKGLFTWKEGAPANRATRLEGLKHSPPLHATHLTGTVSGLRELSLERPLSTT